MHNFTVRSSIFFGLLLLLLLSSAVTQAQSLYSFKSGDYNDPGVWTTDPSGTTYNNPGNTVPFGNGIPATVLTGRQVLISNTGGAVFTSEAITIQQGGVLEVASAVTTPPVFGSIQGVGTLLMHATTNFPTDQNGEPLNGSFFNTGGGTVEFNFAGTANLPVQSTYNHLTVSGGATVVATADALRFRGLSDSLRYRDSLNYRPLIISGNLNVTSGTFQIGENGTAGTVETKDKRIYLTIGGDVNVAQGGNIRVGTFNTNNSGLSTTEFIGRVYADINSGNTTLRPGPFYIVRTAQNNNPADPGYSSFQSKLPFKSGTYHQIHHRVFIKGSFTNNGSVRFHNLQTINLDQISGSDGRTSATSGAATVFLQGADDDTLTCNGVTDFYNLVVDKGSDPTYSLTINPSSYTNFRLWGPATVGADLNNLGNTNINPIMRKALWIKNGTLRLTGKTVIPTLSESVDDNNVGWSINNGLVGPADPSGDFYIPANAALVLDGPDVILLTTADYGAEVDMAYGLTGTIGITKDQRSANQSLSVYGSLTVNSGYLSARESGGLIYWATNGGAGNFTINGGIVDAKQFRSSEQVNTLAGRATFTITGGILRLRGRFQNFSNAPAYSNATALRNQDGNGNLLYSTIRATNGMHASTLGIFNIARAANVFNMSGGDITVLDVGQNSALRLAFEVNSAAANNTVTGGNVNIYIIPGTGNVTENFPASPADYQDANYYVISSAPLNNLNIYRTGGTNGVILTPTTIQTSPSLTVLNNLSLNSGALGANNINVTIGGNFSLASGTTYTPGTNTTTFNGTGTQNFLYSDNTNLPSGLFNLTINKSNGTLLLGGNGTTLNVNGSLSLLNGTFDDGGATINVKGNVTNSAIHKSQSGNGKIVLNGTVLQTINGNGNGQFTNLQLSNAAGAQFINAGQTINGMLTLDQGVLDIGIYPLTVTSTLATAVSPGTTGAYSSTNMIRTAGNMSDGGLTKQYGNINPFIFPVGTTTNYTPAAIAVTATTYGSITVKPVARNHPFVSGTRYLNRYWKVVAGAGFSANPVVSHTYQYVDADVTPANDDVNYTAAVFNPNAWTTTGGNLNATNNVFGFNNLGYITGEFTAGTPPSFNTVTAFYSRQNGDWNTPATWSTDPVNKWGGAAAITTPTASNPVYIGDGNTRNHYVTITTAGRAAGILQLNRGATLDLTTTTGHDFGALDDSLKITGAGTLRISTNAATAEFPKGDFGNFLGASGGTVEYYSTASTSFLIPQTSADNRPLATYYNLSVTPNSGTNTTITLPDRNLRVYGDLTVTGINNNATPGTVRLNDGVTTTARTLTINGNLTINSGKLSFMNTAIRNIILDGARSTPADTLADGTRKDGNISIAGTANTNRAIFEVDGGGTAVANTLSLVGSLINNGGVVFNAGGNRVCNLTFTGATNANWSGTNFGATRVNTVVVNKGTSQQPMLTLNLTGGQTFNGAAGGSLPANWLQLQNGTFRYRQSGSNLNLSISNNAAAVQIPATAAFSMNANVATTAVSIANAPNDNADLQLAGRLEVLSGILNIGTPGATFNNDIEYAPSGLPAITVRGGTLNVNGQIRRPAGTSITLGSLVYNQSGGNVVIGGNSSALGLAVASTRAKFEIDNGSNGSVFNMSGGTLTILRGGGIAGSSNTQGFGDLYIRPGSSSVTGGTITLAPTNSITTGLNATVKQRYTLDANVPLFNLVIGSTLGDTATASLDVSPLRLIGSLTINSNDTLNTTGLNVRLGGDFINSGFYNAYGPAAKANTTVFNGTGTQNATLNTLTTFANVTVNKTTGSSLIFGGTQPGGTIAGNLNLNTGTLNDGGRIVTVLGNVNNSDTHTGAGQLILAGALPQLIGGNGNGSFGNLTINTSAGVSTTADITVNGNLQFTASPTGGFYIDDNRLVLGTGSTVSSNTTFDVSRMIRTNGVLSDGGVTKNFPAGAFNFTFPVGTGTSAIYTPVRFNATSNTAAGSITVRPINHKHPSTTDPASTELDYYWNVSSTGFGGLNVSHTYTYDPSDVPAPAGQDAQFVPGRLVNNAWTPIGGLTAPSTVNAVNQTILISGVNYLNGDYTAGRPSEFGVLNTYYSRNATNGGNWNDVNSWTFDPTGGENGPRPTTPPNGNAVYILSGHTISVTEDAKSALSLNLAANATLNLNSTINNNFGTVSGSGLLRISASASGDYVFPGGNYDSFVMPTGGTVEYYGNANGPLLTQRVYNNVTFNNGGNRILTENVTVNGNLTINGGVLNNSTNNRSLTLKGNWTNAVGNTAFVPGTGTVTFSGSSAQAIGPQPTTFNTVVIAGPAINNQAALTLTGNLTISNGAALNNANNQVIALNGNWNNLGTFNAGSGNAEVQLNGTNQTLSGGNTVFNHLTINGGGNKTLNTNLTVNGRMTFNQGYVVYQPSINPIQLSATATALNASNNSFVAGPVAKTVVGSSSFTFPIGKMVNGAGRYAQIDVSNTGTANNTYTAEYFIPTPNKSSFADPLTSVSEVEYWNLTASGNTKTNVMLTWKAYSNVNNGDKVYVSNYSNPTNTQKWALADGSSSPNKPFTIGAATGTVIANEVNSFGSFTLGYISQDFTPEPVLLVSFNGRWNDGQVDLTWQTAWEKNNDYFEVQRSADARHFESIGRVDGGGTRDFSNQYRFSDTEPLGGTGYYRLKQVDYNGQFEYSKVISIINPEAREQAILYPNPAPGHDKVKLQINAADNKTYWISIYNSQGQLLRQVQYPATKGLNEIALLETLPVAQGMYIVRLQDGTGTRQLKLVID